MREKRKAVLTNTGHKYLASIQHALDEIDSATRRIMTTPTQSTVNLAVAPAFLTRWLVPRLGSFQQQHPDVELRLSASMGEVDFNQTDTDMAIYLGMGQWRNLEPHFLLDTVITPVCSPRLLEDKHPLTKPEDLRHHTLIHVASRTNEWPELLTQHEIEIGSRSKSITFSNTSLALGAAMEGVGIALSDPRLVERELQYSQLVAPFEINLDTGKAFYLVYPQERHVSPAMTAFRDWILAELNNSSPI